MLSVSFIMVYSLRRHGTTDPIHFLYTIFHTVHMGYTQEANAGAAYLTEAESRTLSLWCHSILLSDKS